MLSFSSITLTVYPHGEDLYPFRLWGYAPSEGGAAGGTGGPDFSLEKRPFLDQGRGADGPEVKGFNR